MRLGRNPAPPRPSEGLGRKTGAFLFLTDGSFFDLSENRFTLFGIMLYRPARLRWARRDIMLRPSIAAANAIAA